MLQFCIIIIIIIVVIVIIIVIIIDFKHFEDFASTSVTVRSDGKQGG